MGAPPEDRCEPIAGSAASFAPTPDEQAIASEAIVPSHERAVTPERVPTLPTSEGSRASIVRAGLVAGPLFAMCLAGLGMWILLRGDERRGPRYLCRLPATVNHKYEAMPCVVLDISRRGALLDLLPGHGIEKGTLVRVNWCGDWLEVEARWSKPRQAGVLFRRPLSEGYLTQTLAMNKCMDGPRGRRTGRMTSRCVTEAVPEN
jgi:hypothetical protein